jgi:hypothetical protein
MDDFNDFWTSWLKEKSASRSRAALLRMPATCYFAGNSRRDTALGTVDPSWLQKQVVSYGCHFQRLPTGKSSETYSKFIRGK